MADLDEMLLQADVDGLRELAASMEGGEPPPLTPMLRFCWSIYWTGLEEIDRCIDAVRPLFPRWDGSPFHPQLTLGDGLQVENPRLVGQIVWDVPLDGGQLEQVVAYWARLQRRGDSQGASWLGEQVLGRYPFLRHDPMIRGWIAGETPGPPPYSLSRLSQAALAAAHRKERHYELL